MKDGIEVNIKRIGAGEKISEPGFYDLPIDQHHGQPCVGVSVTSTTLRTMATNCAHAGWAYHASNPNRCERHETTALSLGKAMAAYVEGGPAKLEEAVFVLPPNKPNRPSASDLHKYEAGAYTQKILEKVNFWRKVDADPRTKVTEAQWELIVDMGKVLAEDDKAVAALDGIPEITMAWYDELNDLWVLSRPDQLSVAGLISDYKKINLEGKAMTDALLNRKISYYRYDMQLGLGVEAFQQLTGFNPTLTGLVFQSDQKPHYVKTHAIDEEDIAIGIFECQRQRRIFRQGLDTGVWEKPGDNIGTYKRPEWELEKYREEMSTL